MLWRLVSAAWKTTTHDQLERNFVAPAAASDAASTAAAIAVVVVILIVFGRGHNNDDVVTMLVMSLQLPEKKSGIASIIK